MRQACILLFVMFFILDATPQEPLPCVPCLPQGITFTTQSQIDSFPINFPICTEVGGDVEIRGSNITNLNGLSTLTSIVGDLAIEYNDSLTTLTGLDNLNSIGLSLYLFENDQLANLTGLNNLTSIGYELYIVSNIYLINMTGLSSLGLTGSDFYVESNMRMINFVGLNCLTSIGGSLWIQSNLVLSNLTGIENLNAIGYQLDIHGNPALADIEGLSNLTSIGNDLHINYNPSLTSLTGIDNIDAGSISGLSIWYNDSLSHCAVQSICDYLAAPNGTVEIYYNATGCNSVEEVEDSCGITSLSKLNPEPSLTIYPNPAATTITIETPSKGFLSIHNTSGQQLLQQEITETNTTIDVSGWKSGVYVVKVVGEKGVSVGKFVKN